MRDVFGHEVAEGERRPRGLRNLLRSPAAIAAENAAEIAATIELELSAEGAAEAEGVDGEGLGVEVEEAEQEPEA